MNAATTEKPKSAPRAGARASTSAKRKPAAGSGAAAGHADGKRPPVEGYRLIALIRKTLIERNLPERHIADIMGVTTIYWNSMTNGHRTIKSLGREKLKKVAEFLGIPAVQVRVLAGDIDIEDFFVEKDTEQQLFLSIEKMRLDPQWVSLAPTNEQWDALPMHLKMALATLYERESGRSLMKKAEIEVPDLKLPERNV